MPQLYVGALHFGEAFSDLVPSILALIQGVGSEPECINKTGIISMIFFLSKIPYAYN